MAEEFQESDVIFSDHGEDNCITYQEILAAPNAQHNSWGLIRHKNKNSTRNRKNNNIAANISPERRSSYGEMDGGDGGQLEEEWDDEEMVPPHIIVARRVAGKMAFSVRTGNGRTLKGRDLSQVRNSVLRMTGFLES